MSRTSKGHDCERKLVNWYRDHGYFALRSPASNGVCDVIALRAGQKPLMVEVKTTLRPFHNFHPAERTALALAADLAGGIPCLCHWPPGQKEPTFIFADRWP